MSNRNLHTIYSLEDIEKYLKGKMSAAEMHELEKAALQDPFLSDAIEGYRETSMDTAHLHLQEIKQELLQDKEEAKIVALSSFRSLKWWRIAAAILLIATVSTVTWQLTRNNTKQETVAVTKKGIAPPTDSTAATPAEKNNIAKSDIASTDKPHRSTATEKAIAANQYPADEKALPAKLNRDYEKAIASKDNLADKNAESDVMAAVPSFRQDTTLPPPTLAKKEIADNTASINRSINQYPFAKNERALEGSVAGVYLSNNKMKRVSPKIAIRGKAGNTSTMPIYVIDGIVYESNPPEIPPSKIKNIDILKDTNATALYGAKAANGAIVITTTLKNKPLQGRIVNQNGVGIAGATISVNHNQPNVLTDAQGNFTVHSLDSSALVTVNSVGYQPSQSIVRNNAQNRIVLQENQNTLNEVVVVGYSTQKRTSITGSISTIAANNSVSKTEMPFPDGGWDKLKEYLTSKLSDDSNYTLHGNLEFEFIVDKSQKAKQIHILQSPDESKNDQLTKAIKKGPKWTVTDKNKTQKVSLTF